MSLSRTVMHKLQFARGIGQREMIRANTLPSITRAKEILTEKIEIGHRSFYLSATIGLFAMMTYFSVEQIGEWLVSMAGKL
ncbi:hypothetical protein ANCCEY_09722 [Ancylostoma ceylanicum]|uniref:Uncharacterized protein n=1 Tax=Ancylostoma ceylanicum TaxID=53326 RepID=A0A0D6LJ23_9BILA|nr:hypothetical protein ANCCEY_09722 [Ancylostoma ceylanicum]